MSLAVVLALATLVVLAFISVSVLRATNQVEAYNSAVNRNYEVVGAVTELRSTLLLMESAQRGYLLTSNRDFLQPFNTASGRLRQAMDRVARVTTGDRIQAQRYRAVKPLVQRRGTQLRRITSMAASGKRDVALRSVRSISGERLMAQIRSGLGEMDASARLKLAEQTAKASAEAEKADLLVIANVALVVLLLVFGVLVVRQDVSEQLRHYVTIVDKQKQELELANRELAQLARHDGLTGLVNHRSFHESLSYEFAIFSRFATPLSLLMIDVDNFKEYNDHFGHPAGDSVLKRVAILLHEEARESDTVARYGGEEFAILLPLTNVGDAMDMAERLRRRLEEHNWANRAITISIGVATASPLTREPGDLLEEADKALYRSKARGRNAVTGPSRVISGLADDEAIAPRAAGQNAA
jgi:diguanylate cyclase (GGDEF)-like protein